MRGRLLPVFLLLWPGIGAAAEIAALDAAAVADGTTTIVVANSDGDVLYEVNHERSLQRFSPCSTFKIPNALIALRAGSLNRSDTLLRYNPDKDPRQDWWPQRWDRDQTLATAIRYSAVWYFQELARRTGAAAMQAALDAIGYGNRDISGGIDQFWLSSSLLISATEQVAFLRNFHAGGLGFSAADTGLVKDALIIDEDDNWQLSAKTGGCSLGDGRFLGWYVGYVETPGNTVFFALNTEADDWASVQFRRTALLEFTLRQVSYWPEGRD